MSIEKPEGFDLRDKRSDKTNSGGDWSPADALYAASQRIGPQTKVLLVAWIDTDEKGVDSGHTLYAGAKYGSAAIILNVMRWKQGDY